MDSSMNDSQSEPVNTPPGKKTIALVNIPITDDNAALNVLVGLRYDQFDSDDAPALNQGFVDA